MAAAVLLATALVPFVSGDGEPASALPGVPDPPVVIYSENFENAPDTGNPQLLTAYTSTSPQYPNGTYTSDPFWASAAKCNGFVISNGNSYPAGSCGGNSGIFNALKTLSQALGTIGGTAPATNSAVAAYTAGAAGAANQIEFATVNPITLVTPSRYLTFSVDAAAQSCCSTHPRLQFFVKNANGTETALGGVIDPCTDPRSGAYAGGIRGGHYPASGSFVATGNSVGIVMRNLNGATGGNDGAFDNIQLLDATPALDKSFATPNPITGVSTLTFTLTNTTDLATKLGWGAVDTLAPGVVVANPSNASTTCTNGTVTAVAGSNTITLGGDLAGDTAHLTSCTFTVDVVPSTLTAQGAPAQVFQNCASNLTNVVGLDPPAECATSTNPPVAQLTVAKSSSATSATRQGDTVNYSVTVTNTGGSDYTAAVPATMTDDLSAVLDDATYNNDATATGPNTPTFASPNLSWSGPLAVGASVTINYSMTVTLAGDAVLTNTACIPAGQASAAPCVTVTTPITRAPSIDLVKSADPLTITVGTPITYTFVATNTGNVNLSNPTVTEVAFNGANPAGMTAPDCGAPAPTVLVPGGQMTCTATYIPVQADVDGGAFTNTATSSGVADVGGTVVSPPRTVTLPLVQAASISIEKSAGPGLFTAAGQIVTYSFLLTNTGNVTLTGARVEEGPFSGSGSMSTPNCPAAAASMAPGAQVTCTATYALSQADVDAGQVTNSATSAGTPPSGPEVVSAPDDAIVTITPAPAITLVKSASGGPFTRAGQVVNYSFEVTNVGNVTLANIGITETAFSGDGDMTTPLCPVTTLSPAASTICTASYTLTQADVDANLVSNTATTHGTPPTGPPIDSIPSDAVVPITPAPAITLVKTVDRSTVPGAGAQVTYSFVVTNTGESTLTGLSIVETLFSGSGTLSPAVCPVTRLAPAASTTCTTGYQITAADATASVVNNTATVSGVDPSGVTVNSDPSSARVVVSILAFTGSAIATGLWVSALGALAVGLTVLIRSRLQGGPWHRGTLGRLLASLPSAVALVAQGRQKSVRRRLWP